MRPRETEISEIHAFPAVMAESVKCAVLPLAGGPMHAPTGTVISVRVAEEVLKIPYRVYYDKQLLIKATHIPSETGLISLCLGTRHCDGLIREQCLRRLLTFDQKWTVPFVVQLLGEYVIEVVQPIHERFNEEVEAKYVEFFRQNSQYCQYLEQRAVSYWNEYYRFRFAKHKDYPAVKALAALRKAAGHAMTMSA